MTESLTAHKVRELIAHTLDLDLEAIDYESDIVEDLGASSIAVLDLIVAIEDEYGITISDADVIDNRRVADIVDYVESKL